VARPERRLAMASVSEDSIDGEVATSTAHVTVVTVTTSFDRLRLTPGTFFFVVAAGETTVDEDMIRNSFNIDAFRQLAESCGEQWDVNHLSVVVVGASGDLAKKKILPALFSLYFDGMLPKVQLAQALRM
jgi:hypothetical protein